jgi:hypothetical protein
MIRFLELVSLGETRPRVLSPRYAEVTIMRLAASSPFEHGAVGVAQ